MFIEVPPQLASRISLAKATIVLSKRSFVYTGKPLKPAVTVKVGGKKLAQGRDFRIAYKSNKNPGKARVVVVGQGAYSGSKATTFVIRLGSTKIVKRMSANRAIVVKWQRQKKGKVSYQVRYSLKKNMKGAKVRTAKPNARTTLKIAKLQSGKRYYLQVRTCKKIGKAMKCSAWSARTTAKAR